MDLLIPSYGLLLWSGLLFLLFLITLIDILRNQFSGHNEKLIWILVVIFIPILGSMLYWALGRSKRIRTN